MKIASIFVIDDDPLITDAAQLSLGRKYQVACFPAAEPALEALKKNPPELVLMDIGLSGMNGLDALKEIKQRFSDTPVIMVTAYEDIQTVITAMKSGAYDYVVKPINMDELEVAVQNALDSVRMHREVQHLQERYLKENLPFFIGESDVIQEVMDLVARLARDPDANVLILGETGTGKELIARTIHYRSPNFKGPFVPLNCSALPDNLLESELFGYEKGAFSGADPAGKKGLIETAAGGTLFLDEVCDLSIGAQAKLLRCLEEGEFYKLGGVRKHIVKTRVVAATNRNVDELMDQGLFRRDLYYRLATISIQVPNLSRRQQDISLIASYFLDVYAKKLEKTFSHISPDAVAALRSHEWKGNVRELRNLIERAVLMGEGPELTVKDLGLTAPEAISDQPRLEAHQEGRNPEQRLQPLSAEGMDLEGLHHALDLHYFRQSLELCHGNATRAARLLNMNYFAFKRRQSKLGL
jgi:DNA-binding NtrC family response regulator